TILVFGWYSEQYHRGTLSSPGIYPNITAFEVLNWDALRNQLLIDRQGAGSAAAKVWSRLDPASREFMERTANPTRGQLRAFVSELNRQVLFSEPLDGRLSQTTSLSTAEANRLFLETAFRDALAPGTLRDPTWRSIKVAYAFTYAAMSWLLVVGLLGFC